MSRMSVILCAVWKSVREIMSSEGVIATTLCCLFLGTCLFPFVGIMLTLYVILVLNDESPTNDGESNSFLLICASTIFLLWNLITVIVSVKWACGDYLVIIDPNHRYLPIFIPNLISLVGCVIIWAIIYYSRAFILKVKSYIPECDKESKKD